MTDEMFCISRYFNDAENQSLATEDLRNVDIHESEEYSVRKHRREVDHSR